VRMPPSRYLTIVMNTVSKREECAELVGFDSDKFSMQCMWRGV